MKQERPLILVSNDDGYTFAGIKALIEVAREFGDVMVAAPMNHQSGKGCAITIMTPLRAFKVADEPGYRAFLVDGTPADCVKLALAQLLDGRTPDLVVSGINHGFNTGISTLYSGTLGCAIEATVHNIPAVAFSLGHYAMQADMEPCKPIVRHVMERVLHNGLPPKVLLNVNMPDGNGPYRGIKVATIGMGRWEKEIERRTDPFGIDYYWMTGTYSLDDVNDSECDIHWLNEGYATVTPVRIDQTARDLMDKIATMMV